MKKISKAVFIILLVTLSCKKPYNIPQILSPNSYLVVEGVINSGNDSTIIKLSKTVKLDSKTTINPVLGSKVSVESDQGVSYQLTDLSQTGYYSAPGLNLPVKPRYRLQIETKDGKQYFSDYLTIKATPAIDSIGYTIQNDKVQLYINAHDSGNNTRYYRWEFEETWLFHSKYESEWVLDSAGNKIVHRRDDQLIYYCYGNDQSSNVLVGSTIKLAKDVVYQAPLTSIPITSEKIEAKYSILVKQYALTSDAYSFYENLQKNTEQLGSIFDAQPSQLNGNIHNANDKNDVVIGYMSITNVQTKRIFLTSDILPPLTLPAYPYDCEQDTALYSNKEGYNEVQNVLINPPFTDFPIFAIFGDDPIHDGIIGFTYSTPQCADCTLRGSKKRPAFWK